MKVYELIDYLEGFDLHREVVVIRKDYELNDPRHEIVGVQADKDRATIVAK